MIYEAMSIFAKKFQVNGTFLIINYVLSVKELFSTNSAVGFCAYEGNQLGLRLYDGTNYSCVPMNSDSAKNISTNKDTSFKPYGVRDFEKKTRKREKLLLLYQKCQHIEKNNVIIVQNYYAQHRIELYTS